MFSVACAVETRCSKFNVKRFYTGKHSPLEITLLPVYEMCGYASVMVKFPGHMIFRIL